MRAFIYCLFYLALLGIFSFLIGRILPKNWFHYDSVPYKCYSFERGGNFYNRFHIRKWRNLLPDMSRIVPKMMPSKRLPQLPDYPSMVRQIQETCVAEFTHMALAILGFYCIRLWPGAGGLLLALLYCLGNLPFIMIQRYNRPKLVRYAALLQGEMPENTVERKRNREDECINTQL